MATATIRFVDFMDGRPLPGGRGDLRLEVVPRTMQVVGGGDSGGGSPPRVPPGLPSGDVDRLRLEVGGPITKPTRMVLPDFTRAESVEASGTTDDDGRLRFDIGDVVARLSRPEDGIPVADVVAHLHARFSFMGFMPPRQRFDLGVVATGRSITQDVPVDVGMAAVGHTTATSTKLWFALHRPVAAAQSFRCIVARRPPGIAAPAHEALHALPESVRAGEPGESTSEADTSFGTVHDAPVQFERIDHTCLVEVDGLEPGTAHQYELQVSHEGRTFPILLGTFDTPDPQQRDAVTFSFGSCHLPTVPPTLVAARDAASRRLDRWQELVRRTDDEFVLLLGDQVYGDGLEDKWIDQHWLDRYRLRYRQLWNYWPVRAVLRRTPTYMVLDDHDVRDDFGTVDFVGAGFGDQVDAALEVYRTFQHARNPGGPGDPGGPGERGDPLWYSFERGPAAFFVMDSRTDRVPGRPGVLGDGQRQAIRDWATSEATRAHDVIVFATSIPPALLPTELLRKVAAQFAEDAEDAAELVGLGIGALVGAGIGGLVAGPAGAAVGAMVLGAVGHEVGEEVVERGLGDVDRSLLIGKDLAERWDLAGTQEDLVEVLDLLFDLANGVGEDERRRRAVFLLAGDIHTGTMHLIRSLPIGHGRRHTANPVLVQLTSSAISHEPVDREVYELAVSRIDDDLDIGLKDLSASDLWAGLRTFGDKQALEDLAADKLDELLGRDPASYTLDPNLEGRYRTDFAGLLMDHNVGRMEVERVGPGRRYRFDLSIEGPDDALEQVIEMDLESPADEVPRFSLTDRGTTHLYLQVEQALADGSTRPLDGVEVEVVDQDAPAPRGDDAVPPEEGTTVTGPGTTGGGGPAKVITTRTTSFEPPTEDEVLARGRTDRFGVVWVELDRADRVTTAGTVVTETTTEKFGTFPGGGAGGVGGGVGGVGGGGFGDGSVGGGGVQDRPGGQSVTQTHTSTRSLRELRPDLYFRLHLPDGRTVDTRDLDGGFFLNRLEDVGTSRDRATFVVPRSRRPGQVATGGTVDEQVTAGPSGGETSGGSTSDGADLDLPPKVVIKRPDHGLDRRPGGAGSRRVGPP